MPDEGVPEIVGWNTNRPRKQAEQSQFRAKWRQNPPGESALFHESETLIFRTGFAIQPPPEKVDTGDMQGPTTLSPWAEAVLVGGISHYKQLNSWALLGVLDQSDSKDRSVWGSPHRELPFRRPASIAPLHFTDLPKWTRGPFTVNFTSSCGHWTLILLDCFQKRWRRAGHYS